MVDRIQVDGRINEEGKLEVELPANIPPGRVRVTVEPIASESGLDKFRKAAREAGAEIEKLGFTEEEINATVEEVRQELHDKRHGTAR